MPWPKDGVDVLKEHNIHRGSLYKNDDCRCILGWLEHWFGTDTEEFNIVRKIACEIIGHSMFTEWNDNFYRPKGEIARKINKITATAGYVVDNPQAKNI